MEHLLLTAGSVLASLNELLTSEMDRNALQALCQFEVEITSNCTVAETDLGSSQLFALLENYICRGEPTLASLFIEKSLTDKFAELVSIKESSDEAIFSWTIPEKFKEKLSSSLVIVDSRIVIDRDIADFKGSKPARTFFQKLPKPVQQIIQPERFFTDGLITEDDNRFFRQQVDFALESPGGSRWIIEVDGKQHEQLDQAIRDKLRDNALFESGWRLGRIKTTKVRAWKKHLADFVSSFEADSYIHLLQKNYKSPLWADPQGRAALELTLVPFAIARIQKVLVILLRYGMLSLQEKKWRIAVIERDVPAALLALHDFVELLQHFYSLLQLKEPLPHISLAVYDNAEFQSTYNFSTSLNTIQLVQHGCFREERRGSFDVVLDLSVLRRHSLEQINNRDFLTSPSGVHVLIRSGFRQISFTSIATSDPVTYSINRSDQEESLLYFLRNIFRKKYFRDGQLKIIKRALSRKNTIGLLPTGAGKSLCYQLVAFLQPGLTLIIDPLRSLMIDQNENLRKYRIDRSAYISSDLTTQERNKVEKRFYQAAFQFLFIAPERFQIKEYRQYVHSFVANCPIAYAVIDEAHCVSEWGHDFRTSYLLLSRTIRNYCQFKGQPPPIYALTGTASAVVLRDVKMDLGIGDGDDDRNAIITPATFDRPELTFNIYQCSSADKYSKLNQIIKEIGTEFGISTETLFKPNDDRTYSGLIFCPHVNSTPYSIDHLKSNIGNDYSFPLSNAAKICPKCGSPLTQKLNSITKIIFWGCEKHPVCKYTNGLLNYDEPRHFKGLHIYSGKAPKSFGKEAWEKYKIRAQKEFIQNDVSLMITNKAFGMGIDKPNIRYTIHYCIPQSIESYYQEAGRAGRDRQKAFCALIFSDDEAADADKRLDPKLSIDEVMKLPKVKRNNEGDIHRNLFFQTTSFKGKEQEFKALTDILHGSLGIRLGLLNPGEQYEVTVLTQFHRNDKNQKIYDEDSTEKALYRLLLIGLIDDYTIDYKENPRIFHVKIVKKQPEEYSLQLYNYLSLHKADFLSIYPDHAIFLNYLKSRPENHLVLQCLGELLDFIYSVIEPQRRQALATLVEAVRTNDNHKFRNLLLRYLEPSEEFNKLFWIFPQSTDLAEWTKILEKAESDESANKLLGICLRNLESYPNSVGLRFIAASLRLALPDEKEDYALADFTTGMQYLKENYESNQVENILSYFVFYILGKSRYSHTNLLVAKILLNEYNYSKYALQLMQGDYEEIIRKLGAAYLLNQINKPLQHLVSHLKG